MCAIDDKAKKDLSGFTVSRLKANTRVLIESTIGTLYALRVLEGRLIGTLIEVHGTDPLFRPYPPKRGLFLESRVSKASAVAYPDWIGKDLRMLIQFADADFLTEPVATALIEGDGWKYEAII